MIVSLSHLTIALQGYGLPYWCFSMHYTNAKCTIAYCRKPLSISRLKAPVDYTEDVKETSLCFYINAR